MTPGPSTGPKQNGSPSLAGKLSAVSLFDLCQFLMLNRKTGSLTVRGGGGGGSGGGSGTAYLTFSEGQLCTAMDDNLREGADVVLRVLQWAEGTFEFSQGPVPPDVRMTDSTENILLDAARRIDEMAEAGARDGDGNASSAEQAFREKRARAASIVDVFRSLAADTVRDGVGGSWREEAARRLLEPAVERLVLSAEGKAGLIRNGRFEEIEVARPAEVSAWMEQLAPLPVRSAGRGVRQHRPVDEARPGPEDLWARRVQAPDGDLVVVSRTRGTWPGEAALPFGSMEHSALDAISSGLIAFLGSSATGPTAWPAWEAAAAWLARRAAVRPATGWVIEELPRYDWPKVPGRWRRVAPSVVRQPGALERLARTTRAAVLVFDGLPPSATLDEAGRLAVAGLLVVVVDAADQVTSWLAAAERPGPLTPGRTELRFAATVVVRAEELPAGFRIQAGLILPVRTTRPNSAPGPNGA
jgi:hypothetical protein